MPLDEPQPLRQSLRGLSWARLITAAMVVVAGAVLRYAGSFPFQFLPFTLAVSAAALVSCLLLVGSVHGADLRRFAWMQVCLDVALVTGIIAASGGSDSVFSFLYVLTVLEGSYLLGRSGGLVAASLAGLLYVDVVLGRHLLTLLGLAEPLRFPQHDLDEALAGWVCRQLADEGLDGARHGRQRIADLVRDVGGGSSSRSAPG